MSDILGVRSGTSSALGYKQVPSLLESNLLTLKWGMDPKILRTIWVTRAIDSGLLANITSLQ